MVSRVVLFVLFGVLFLGIIGTSHDAFALTPVSSCQTLNVAGETYVVISDITTSGTCFVVSANGITLDGDGHSISGDGTGFGIDISSKNGITVTDTTISDFHLGVKLYFGTNNVISDNFFSNNSENIQLRSFSNGNTISGNTISNSQTNGISLVDSDNNLFLQNVFELNVLDGISIYKSNNNVMTENLFKSNKNGIATATATGNSVTNNEFDSNNVGVGLYSSSSLNSVHNNSFIDNAIQARDSTGNNIWNQIPPIGGNTWNNFDEPNEGCFDTNSDGFCDDPFVFFGNSDQFPICIVCEAPPPDDDGDGYPADVDCDDNDSAINPGAEDSICDGIDNNCSGDVDENYVASVTFCGVGACADNTGLEVCHDGELLDTCNPFEGATAEICDGIDNDCDGIINEAPMCFALCNDNGDFDVGLGQCVCDTGFGGDFCEGIDSDLDGIIDDVDNCVYFTNPDQSDADGDGIGDACNDANDADGDEFDDLIDNCPAIFNPDQSDVDGDGLGDVCDNQSPVCSSATPSVNSLWPANNKMTEVFILGVTDPDGDDVTITVTEITQDEPINGNADGSGVGTNTAQVRAQSDGNGDGRVYEISFSAVDGVGGMCVGTVNVGVPHDQSDTTVIDSGQNYNSLE
ncbi:MAG: right-handed parallel beta-helix repeat-containing protein [Nitrosopumilus sp.]|uniref:NosD domain-containing protein n=1 Tax=Nitrosopumilus sp. TaxID=2024843 RepID=UPI00247BD0C9|nr:NosD domain-containing protein [Nitrosopumilus sp.]MCV0392646.1 right-handed parallel beta-helix repeat-containing protein [Nitrosopumilus sp.]